MPAKTKRHNPTKSGDIKRHVPPAIVDPSNWRSGLTTSERGYGSAWQKARAAYLFKHPLCVECEAMTPPRFRAAVAVDHVIPHRGDKVLFWDSDNWAGLCISHHNAKTARGQ